MSSEPCLSVVAERPPEQPIGNHVDEASVDVVCGVDAQVLGYAEKITNDIGHLVESEADPAFLLGQGAVDAWARTLTSSGWNARTPG